VSTADQGPQLYTVAYGRELIRFHVRRSKRKTLGISVYPDLSVVVSAPEASRDEQIAARVKKRAAWILKQQEFFRGFLPPLPPRQYVSGETHRYLGRQYRLKVHTGRRESVSLRAGHIEITVRRKQDHERVRVLLDEWLLAHALVKFHLCFQKCIERLAGHETMPPRLNIKRMKTRWGYCGRGGVIFLNPELIKVPSHCIEYVITHELCHLRHGGHGKLFRRMLNRVMPDWERRKARLERIGAGL
jgi:predicted metal-dependent hydrolase